MKNKLHKTLLSLLLVMMPPYFSVFTEEGNRVSDNVLLWLTGQESLALNLAEADSAFTEDEVRRVYPDLEWQCGAFSSQFGDQACNAIIGNFNDLPARHVVMYFQDKHLSAIKIEYREQYHNALLQHLIETLGPPDNTAELSANMPQTDDVVRWHTGKGLVAVKKTLSESDQPALMWIGSAS